MATLEPTPITPTSSHACRHVVPAPAPQGLAPRAWMGAAASARLSLVFGLAGVAVLLVHWATAI